MRVGRVREQLDRRRRERRPRRERRNLLGRRVRQPRELRRQRAEALLALTRAGAEAGVALDLLDIEVAAIDAMLEVRQRDVLAATQHDLLRLYAPPLPAPPPPRPAPPPARSPPPLPPSARGLLPRAAPRWSPRRPFFPVLGGPI